MWSYSQHLTFNLPLLISNRSNISFVICLCTFTASKKCLYGTYRTQLLNIYTQVKTSIYEMSICVISHSDRETVANSTLEHISGPTSKRAESIPSGLLVTPTNTIPLESYAIHLIQQRSGDAVMWGLGDYRSRRNQCVYFILNMIQ
jgi:hypothetical protein